MRWAGFESLSIDGAGIEDLLTAFGATGSTTINGNQWQYTTGLTGALGATGGTANSNAFVVLDGSNNGMMIVPEPSSVLLSRCGAVSLLLRRRR